VWNFICTTLFLTWTSLQRPEYVHVNIKNGSFGIYGHGYGTNSRVNLNSWNSSYGLAGPDADSSPQSNSGHGVERIESDRTVPGAAFNSVEVQSVPIH
jgi:hypothetical protein